MKIVIDSSAWIEWFIASPTADKLAPNWPSRNETLVPTLVQLEIAKWLKREISEEAMDNALAYMELCVVVPLDTRIALRAADICAAHKLSTADAIVYATALENGAQLLTCDAQFKGLDRVVYVGKG
ncbi:MAG: type II toxin-antitoxin system VapC family toxin [Beijerinckiaceae bacterium]